LEPCVNRSNLHTASAALAQVDPILPTFCAFQTSNEQETGKGLLNLLTFSKWLVRHHKLVHNDDIAITLSITAWRVEYAEVKWVFSVSMSEVD
jgi:hypothetical protein